MCVCVTYFKWKGINSLALALYLQLNYKNKVFVLTNSAYYIVNSASVMISTVFVAKHTTARSILRLSKFTYKDWLFVNTINKLPVNIKL